MVQGYANLDQNTARLGHVVQQTLLQTRKGEARCEPVSSSMLRTIRQKAIIKQVKLAYCDTNSGPSGRAG